MTVSAEEARALALKKLSGREPLTGEAPVRLSSETVEALQRAEFTRAEAAEALDLAPDDEQAQQALEQATALLAAAQDAVDETSVVMRFQALEPDAYDALVERFPPTDAEQQQAKDDGMGRPEFGRAFKPALIAATCTFPAFDSAEQAERWLWGGQAHLSRAEADDLFRLAYAVCNGRREVVDWGKDSARTSV